MTKLKLFALLLFFWLSKLCIAQEKMQVVVGNSTNGFPPFAIIAPEKPTTGIVVDILKALEKNSNLVFEPITLPEKRMRILERSGHLDAVLTAKEWMKPTAAYTFSDPLLQLSDVVFSLTSSKASYQSIVQLRGRTVGMVKGYSYGSNVEEARQKKIFSPIYGNDELHLLRMLLSARIDGAIITRQVGLFHIKKNRWHKKFRINRTDSQIFDYRILYHRRYEPQMKRFNAALAKLKASPEYDKILSRYYIELD